jgi:hypothetical protein
MPTTKLQKIIEKRIKKDPLFSQNETLAKMTLYYARAKEHTKNPNYKIYLEYQRAYLINTYIIEDLNEEIARLQGCLINPENKNHESICKQKIQELEERKRIFYQGTIDTKTGGWLYEPYHQIKDTYMSLKKDFELEIK